MADSDRCVIFGLFFAAVKLMADQSHTVSYPPFPRERGPRFHQQPPTHHPPPPSPSSSTVAHAHTFAVPSKTPPPQVSPPIRTTHVTSRAHPDRPLPTVPSRLSRRLPHCPHFSSASAPVTPTTSATLEKLAPRKRRPLPIHSSPPPRATARLRHPLSRSPPSRSQPSAQFLSLPASPHSHSSLHSPASVAVLSAPFATSIHHQQTRLLRPPSAHPPLLTPIRWKSTQLLSKPTSPPQRCASTCPPST